MRHANSWPRISLVATFTVCLCLALFLEEIVFMKVDVDFLRYSENQYRLTRNAAVKHRKTYSVCKGVEVRPK